MSEHETYEVGEVVQFNGVPGWFDARVTDMRDGKITGLVWDKGAGPVSWSAQEHGLPGTSKLIRKHPTRGWKVGDECEVQDAYDRWHRGSVKAIGTIAMVVLCEDGNTSTWGIGSRHFRRPQSSAAPPADRPWAVGDECEARHESWGDGWHPAVVESVLPANGRLTIRIKDCPYGSLWRLDVATEIRRPQSSAAPRSSNRAYWEPPTPDNKCTGTTQPTCSNPLNAVIDGVTLRDLLSDADDCCAVCSLTAAEHKLHRGRDCEAYESRRTAAQRSAVSSYRSAELRARIAAGPSQDAERWREEQRRERRERGPKIRYCEED